MDSRREQHPKWLDKLQIIDSTTITLLTNDMEMETEGSPPLH